MAPEEIFASRIVVFLIMLKGVFSKFYCAVLGRDEEWTMGDGAGQNKTPPIAVYNSSFELTVETAGRPGFFRLPAKACR